MPFAIVSRRLEEIEIFVAVDELIIWSKQLFIYFHLLWVYCCLLEAPGLPHLIFFLDDDSGQRFSLLEILNFLYLLLCCIRTWLFLMIFIFWLCPRFNSFYAAHGRFWFFIIRHRIRDDIDVNWVVVALLYCTKMLILHDLLQKRRFWIHMCRFEVKGGAHCYLWNSKIILIFIL